MNGYCGYRKEFRRNMSGLTVGDLIKELQKFPESAEISCCGDFKLYIHYSLSRELLSMQIKFSVGA